MTISLPRCDEGVAGILDLRINQIECTYVGLLSKHKTDLKDNNLRQPIFTYFILAVLYLTFLEYIPLYSTIK